MVVGHENNLRFFEIFEIYIGVVPANFRRVRTRNALAKPTTRAVPFRSIYRSCRDRDQRCAGRRRSVGECLYEFFVSRDKDGVAEFKNDNLDFSVWVFLLGVFLQSKQSMLRTLVKNPFVDSVFLRIARSIYAHYAKIKRQTEFCEVFDCGVDWLPFVFNPFWVRELPKYSENSRRRN